MKEFSVKYSNIIKGVAILFMLFHHLFWNMALYNTYGMSFSPLTIERTAQIAAFSRMCVPLFTFVSGVGLLYSYKKMKKKKNFFLIRCLKLLPTFYVIVVISYILYLIFGLDYIKVNFFNSNIYLSIIYLIFDLTGLSTILNTPTIGPVWWYIGISLMFSFIVPIIYKLAKKYGWFLVGVGLFLIPRLLCITPSSSLTALPYIFILFLGMYCEDTNFLSKIANKKIISNNFANTLVKLLIYFVLLLCSYIYFTHTYDLSFMELSYGVIPFLIIIIVCEFIAPIKYIAETFAFFGKHSIIIYLIHDILLNLFRPYFYSFPHFIISFIVLFVLSLIIALVVEFILNKIGYYNRFNKLINKLKE